ncbi:MAG TPA: TonB family protein [Steroidobacteraceae bacterium]|jgi:protein TonB|nr:TonB family protein [Steroidobacteraceae bacterium]
MSSKAKRTRYLLPVLMCLTVSGLGVGAFALVRGMLSGGPGQPKKVVQEIHVIRPPPPPPDVPPPPPPPPEEKVDVTEPEKQPDPTPSDEPPPSEQLGLDSEGSAGGDAFGLMGHKGGRDLLASGGSAFAWYSNLMQNEIRDCLADEKEMHKGSVRLRMWLRDDGTIDRVNLAESTGDRVHDKAIETRMVERCRRFSQAPPAGTPQPITLRLVSRG